MNVDRPILAVSLAIWTLGLHRGATAISLLSSRPVAEERDPRTELRDLADVETENPAAVAVLLVETTIVSTSRLGGADVDAVLRGHVDVVALRSVIALFDFLARVFCSSCAAENNVGDSECYRCSAQVAA